MAEALALLLIALQMLDWWTTRRVIRRGGRELNPAMAWIIARFGFAGLLVVKLAGAAGIAAVALHYGLWWVLALLCAAFAFACWHNWRA